MVFFLQALDADAVSLNSPVVGNPYFTDTGQSLGDSPSWDVALGDLDGDNDLDALVANGNGSTSDEPDRIWLNDGQGVFSSTSGIGDSTTHAVALGDLDGDNDLDIFVGTSGYNDGDTIWFNDGAGTFTDTGQLLDNGNTVAIALGDIDNDMDLDAITADSWAGGNRIWLNNGSGFFTDSGQVLGSGESNDVVLVDLDSDSDLDVFIANGTSTALGRNRVWFNDGSGLFENSMQALGNSNSRGVALGDLDDDGDLDAFVANRSGVFGQENKVWLNDGKGFFVDSMQALGNSTSSGVILSDVDFDGDKDAIVANDYEESQVWLNDGKAVFSASQLLSPFPNQGLAAGKLDKDDIPDLFFVNAGFCDFICDGYPNEVWIGKEPIKVYVPIAITQQVVE